MLNLDKIKNALNKQAATTNTNKKFEKTKYFKPEFKRYNIRFLPYESPDGEPYQEVLFYSNLKEKSREVAPFQFGLPDPVKELYEEKRREKDGWSIAKHLKPQKKFFICVIDRDNEEAGPQVWEFNDDTRDSLVSILVSSDYVEEIQTIFTPDKGYDWELNVTQALDGNNKPKTFNGFPIKKYNLTIRKRPSVLHADKETVDKWLAAAPNLLEMYKRQCKSPELLLELLEDFCARKESESETVSTAKQEQKQDVTATVKQVAASKEAPKPKVKKVEEEKKSEDDLDDSAIEGAFADI